MSYIFLKPESDNCDYFPDTDEFSAQDVLRACRVCLATDTKLLDLHRQFVAQTFADITGTPVSLLDRLPQHICTACECVLQKCAAFRSKCRHTHTTLQNILVHTPTLTTDYIRTINRTSVLPKTFVDTEDLIIDTDIDDVKQEYSTLDLGIPDTGNDFDSFEESDNLEVKSEINTINTVTRSAVSLKRKKANSKDTTAVTVKKLVKRARKVKNELKVESLQDKKKETELAAVKRTPALRSRKSKNNDVDSKVKKKEPKKKRLFNRNTDEDVKGIAEKFDMEVVILTREQQLQEIQSRKDTKDYINARYQCNVCIRGFLKEIGYKKHMAYHDPNNSHECDICHERFPAQAKLLAHIRRHRYHFICKRCGKQVGRNTSAAKMHFKWHDGFKYQCKHCDRDFNKQSTHNNHVRENHTPARCEQCGEQFAGTRALVAHRETMHCESHRCERCGTQFHNADALARHAMSDGPGGSGCDARVPCPECGDAFASPTDLKTHLQIQHSNQPIYRCEQCQRTYARERGLAVHWVRAHKSAGAPPRAPGAKVICEVCARAFATETQLRYHQRTHTGERPYQCPICPKRFQQKTPLKMHINTHTGERPYKCALCPDAFKTYAQRYKHKLLVHTKERRYKCHLCEKNYVVSSDLKMHIRTVHMKLPFPPRARPRRSKADAGAPLAPPKVELELQHDI